MDKLTYVKLLRTSRRLTKRSHEAEDLLQAVLLAAVDAGRADLSCDRNRHWVIGALKKRALFDARSAIRRRQRESTYAMTASLITPATASATSTTTTNPGQFPTVFVSTLPKALRSTALLALTGHNRKEIAWLLSLSDPALRQRIRKIRKRWRSTTGQGDSKEWDFSEIPGLKGDLSFGHLRKAMLKAVARQAQAFASHDPDGHLFIVCSQNTEARQLPNEPKSKEE